MSSLVATAKSKLPSSLLQKILLLILTKMKIKLKKNKTQKIEKKIETHFRDKNKRIELKHRQQITNYENGYYH